jgi:hypothetical protein
MSQPIKQKPIDGRNNKDIHSIEGSEWTLETASIGSTIGDGNAQGNGINMINVLVEVPLPFLGIIWVIPTNQFTEFACLPPSGSASAGAELPNI